MTATNQQVIAGLYAAFYNRAPDKSGLDFWVNTISVGNEQATFNKIAADFIRHPKFSELYDDLFPQQFVETIYRNVLGSAGDDAGISFWVESINAGTSRSDMVAGFVFTALNIDLNDTRFDNLTVEEKTQAQIRHDTIVNKVNAGLDFVITYGNATNITKPEDLNNDPAYLASIASLLNIDNTESSAITAAERLSLENGVIIIDADESSFVGDNPIIPEPEPEPEPRLFQISEMEFIGSFRISGATIGDSSSNYGGGALAYNAANNSLFMTGHIYDQAIAEFEIPDLIVNSDQIEDLAIATTLQEFSLSIPDQLESQNGLSLGGYAGGSIIHDFMVVGEQLIGSFYAYYDAGGTAEESHFVVDSLDLDTATVSPLYHLEGVAPGAAGGYMTAVQEEFQDALGGVTHITGQNGIAIVSRGTTGPTAIGFDAADLLNGLSTIDANPYAYYTLHDMIGGNWDEDNTFGLNGVTATEGVVFVPGTDSILFFGRTAGDSGVYYGEGDDYNDPFSGGKGYGAVNGEYDNTIWAYDVNEFIQVQNGELGASEIEPYAMWNYEMDYSEGSKINNGTAFDPETGYLYISVEGGNGDAPIINVFDLF